MTLSERRIIESLAADYGIEVATLTPLLLGMDLDAAVYKAQAQNGRAYFIKLKRGHQHDLGAALLSLLHAEGIREIIPPLKTSQGHLTQPLEEYTLIVYPFIENESGFSRDLTSEQWITLGKVMRKVHDLQIPPAIQTRLRRENYSPKWRESVRSFYGLMEAEPTGDVTARELLMFMKRHEADIHRLVDRAETLGQLVRHKPANFVLCHADIHGGNVLLGADGSIHIVDWDDPVMAPKERDLMFIGGGVANVWNHPHEEESFYQGYGKTQIDRQLLAYYRHERIVEDIAIYAQELLLTKAGGYRRMEMYKHFTDMFAPRGVVDIAFKTDM